MQVYEKSKEDALSFMENADEKYKIELIQELNDTKQISFYKQGEYEELCAGPHISNVCQIKAIKLLSVAGAYWRSSEKNQMLTRIYGVSFRAMAFAIANEVIFLENAFLSVLSPKGCAKLLWNDSTRGDETAKILKITAGENKEWGFVDRIVCEPVGGAHMNKEMVFDNVKSILEEVLCKYERMTGEQVKIERYQKYRKLGNELFDCYSE